MRSTTPFAYIIDDDPLNNAVLTKALQKKELVDTVLSSTSAENALFYLDQLESEGRAFPDLIFVDLKMPRMSGWEFVEIFQDRFSSKCDTKIIILSGTSNINDLVMIEMKKELVHYIQKPVTVGELEVLFSNFVNQKV
ncbi:MAG TPA: response regulator [Cryomorphaceae bacterium]|nr:response regulator [Cryomorphaceae bacterium]